MNDSGRVQDAIVVGGGHNGLTCAAYLGRAGLDVTVLERRDVLGGAAVTEALWPGYRVSTASYVVSLMQPQIVRDLDLERHGYHVFPLDPAYFAPFPDGRGLLMWDDPRRAREEIAKFSRRDADAFIRYSDTMSELATLVRPLLLKAPPSLSLRSTTDIKEALALGAYVGRRRDKLARVVDLMTMSVSDFLDEYFEHESIKGAVGFGGTIGSWGGPKSPGSAYVLLHHRIGEVAGFRGAWGFVRGGMGGLSEAIASSARSVGVNVRTGAEVASIDVSEGRARSVTLVDGTTLRARAVVSATHPVTTFLSLVERRALPAELLEEVGHYRTRGSTVKVNMAISELPDLSAMPGREPGPQHPEFVITPSIEYLERAWDDAKYGRPAREPMVDCVIPTTKDPTLAPEGKHVLTAFVQYAPYDLAEGTWEDQRETFGDRVIETISRYAPGFSDSVIHREVLTPVDLEERFGLIGGNIFHGEMSLDQMFTFRPAARASGYATPLDGLYLCASGTHPGGGVMGAPGYNAARVVARDLRRRARRRRLTRRSET
ncbi:MAG: phytoene desaturase family protein [Actinomycetota bacterium]